MDVHVHDASATTRFMPTTTANRSDGAGDTISGLHSGSTNRLLREEMCKIEEGFRSSDEDTRLIAVRRLRQVLSEERDFLKQEDLPKTMVPKLLEWLKNKDNLNLQVDALRALTSIAAGPTEQSSVLLQNDAVNTLVSLLESSDDEILEQSVWVLGNLAGEGTSARDAVLNSGALKALVECIHDKSKLSLLRIGAWTLSNLCDGQPRPVFEICSILPTLANLLKMSDTEVLSHVCWTLSHLCDGPCAHIQQVVNADVCWRLVELLMHRSWRVTKPALRAIGNIVCAEDEQDYTQHIISCGAVPCLRQLIAHSNREIQKEACWTLSNIAAGTIEQIQYVLDSGSIPHLVSLASSEDTDTEVKSEACWVVLNATSCGSDAQIEYLVKQGCVAVLGELLAQTSMVMMALEGLERILQWVEADPDNRAPFLVGDGQISSPVGSGTYASLMATSKIEQLENHKSAAIAKRASKIWRQHFVTCAICGRAFSKHSPDTRFCDECKCHVCNQCNCSRYHLSYQENWWKQVTEMETSVKEAKQATKRNRRAKKKMKIKEKKAAMKNDKDDPEVDGELAEQFDNQDLDSSPDELELPLDQKGAFNDNRIRRGPPSLMNGDSRSKKEVEQQRTILVGVQTSGAKTGSGAHSGVSRSPALPDGRSSTMASAERQAQNRSRPIDSKSSTCMNQVAALPTRFSKGGEDSATLNDTKHTMRRVRKNNRSKVGDRPLEEKANAQSLLGGAKMPSPEESNYTEWNYGNQVPVADKPTNSDTKRDGEKNGGEVKKWGEAKKSEQTKKNSEVRKAAEVKKSIGVVADEDRRKTAYATVTDTTTKAGSEAKKGLEARTCLVEDVTEVKKSSDLKKGSGAKKSSEAKKGVEGNKGLEGKKTAELKKGAVADGKKNATEILKVPAVEIVEKEPSSPTEPVKSKKTAADGVRKEDENTDVPVAIATVARDGLSKKVVQKKNSGKGEADNGNEHLVSYLMETGSILALAQYLDDED